MKTLTVLILLALVPNLSNAAFCDGLINCDKSQEIFEAYVDEWMSYPEVTSAGITECISGVPLDQHGLSRPDLLAEACIQITFTDEQSLSEWRSTYGGSTFRIDGVAVYLGPVRIVRPEPGVVVHN